MMMYTVFIAISIFSFAIARPDDDEDFYYQVFEEVDVDVILDNERVVRAYLNCFYDEGPCSPHQQAVKDSIPDVMKTVCGKCNPKQKGIYKHTLNRFIPTHQEDWQRILSIYDPTGEYWPNVKAFMES